MNKYRILLAGTFTTKERTVSIDDVVRKPRWMGTPLGQTALYARCISPCEGPWLSDEFLTDDVLLRRLKRELMKAQISCAHVVQPKRDTFRLGSTNEDWHTENLGHDVFIRYPDEPVNALWMDRNDTIVTDLSGKPFLIVHGDRRWLGMHYHDGCIGQLNDIFLEHGVASRNVSIHAFFGNPRGCSNYYAHLEGAGRQLGMKIECQLRLPKDGHFGYGEHPTLHAPNLGIFALRC